MRLEGNLMKRAAMPGKRILLVMAVAGGIFVSTAGAQTSTPAKKAAKKAGTPVQYRPSRFAKRAKLYYRLYWGIDSLRVKSGESGEIVRFSFRVLDAEKAAPLNDLKAKTNLIDPHAGVSLVVPSLPFMGLMRDKNKPVAGKIYWIGFSNKGRYVKPGDRVNVVIGNFHANGLVVE